MGPATVQLRDRTRIFRGQATIRGRLRKIVECKMKVCLFRRSCPCARRWQIRGVAGKSVGHSGISLGVKGLGSGKLVVPVGKSARSLAHGGGDTTTPSKGGGWSHPWRSRETANTACNALIHPRTWAGTCCRWSRFPWVRSQCSALGSRMRRSSGHYSKRSKIPYALLKKP